MYEIYLRSKEDYQKDFEFKAEVVRRLSERYRIVAIFEDSKAVAETLRKLLPGVEVHLVS